MNSPASLEELTILLGTSPNAAALLESLEGLERTVSVRFGDVHLASDTEFLSTYYSSYVFALLLDGDVHEARLLLSRTPPSLLKASTALQDSLTLLRAVWEKEYTVTHKILRHSSWPDVLMPLVQTYQAYFRSKVIADMSLSYETIRLSSMASYLGIELDSNLMNGTMDDATTQLVQEMLAKGWTYDQSAGIFNPKPDIGAHIDVSPENIRIGQLAALVGNHSVV